MSLKCLTVVIDDDGSEICVLARGGNGDLNGHGEDLKQFLRGFAIVRDLKVKDRRSVAVNMGQLACLLIKHIRTNLGTVELLPTGTRSVGEEYIYSVYPRHAAEVCPSLLNIRVEISHPSYSDIDPANESTMTVVYDGLLDEFNPPQVLMNWERTSDLLADHPRVQRTAANAAAVS